MSSVLWWVYSCTEITEAQFWWRCEARRSEFICLQAFVTTLQESLLNQILLLFSRIFALYSFFLKTRSHELYWIVFIKMIQFKIKNLECPRSNDENLLHRLLVTLFGISLCWKWSLWNDQNRDPRTNTCKIPDHDQQNLEISDQFEPVGRRTWRSVDPWLNELRCESEINGWW